MSTAAASAASKPKRHIPGFATLQRLGKSLMLPIAVLPAAGILLRLGQPDLLGKIDAPIIGPFFEAMSAAGGAIFDNLALLFAVGVAIGFAKKSEGATALAAVVGYVALEGTFAAMSPVVLEAEVEGGGTPQMINYSVLGGILIGLITAALWDKYHTIKLPTYLGFFGGRRFVPIVVATASLFVGFGLSYFYPIFDAGLTNLGEWIGASGAFGAFAYGTANRLLIPVGLHHILNSFIWFIYGSWTDPATGVTYTGELTRFAQGDPEAGRLTSGFYPVLMFGLPAAALAMIQEAKPKQKKLAVGILGAAGITAFLTGVTEPLEFAFMFVAFPLYLVHALLTGLSMAVAYMLDIHLGFSFSAGLIDLLLYGTAPAAKNIPLLLLMGVGMFVLYYLIFRFAIRAWNLRTPGREDEAEAAAEEAANVADELESATVTVGPPAAAATQTGEMTKAAKVLAAFGGAENLEHVDACITRLRMEVKDKNKVDKAALKQLGAAGVIEVGNNVQAIFGTEADTLKNEILEIM